MKTRAAALALLALALPAAAQQEAAAANRGVEAVTRLITQRPEDPTLYFYLARFQAQAGDAKASTAALQKVLELGEGLLPVRDFGFENVWADEDFQAVRAKIEATLPRADTAAVAFRLEDTHLLPEGIAYDPPSHSFFVGSTAKKKIVRVGPGRAVKDFSKPEDSLDFVLGLAIDSPRRRLYAVSTSALTEEGEKNPRNKVISYNIDTGDVVRTVQIVAARQLNDVAVAPGGKIYATDSAAGAVYEIEVEGPVREIIPPDYLRGVNGIAIGTDPNQVYAAISTGIVVIDPRDSKYLRLPVPKRESVAAIDGLYWWQGQLIGVQNVTSPGRVILMTLSADGRAITKVETLLSHHHAALDEPTTGAVTEYGFYLLAGTQVSRLNRQGRIEREDSLDPPTVLRVALPH
jgi:DNA-binding beta-propeller fold protein YncE